MASNITKSVSDNPPANSVAAPHNSKAVHADVDRKMRFYSVLIALREGRYPSNDQIDETLKYVTEHAPFDVNSLSSEGKKLVKDARNIVDTANNIVKEKNADEKLQNFLWKTRQGDLKRGKVEGEIVPGFSKDQSKESGQKALEHLRTIFTLIATNQEIRKLLSDSKVIGQDLFADAASKAANVARPNEEKLAKVDEPAPEGWKSSDGRVVGADETPKYDMPNLKKAKESKEEGKDTAKESAKESAKDVADKTKAKSEQESDLQKAVSDVGNEKKEGKSKSQNLKEKIPENHRQTAKENYEKSKKHLQEKFPKERRDKFIERLKKVLYENQKHKDWRDAFNFFFTELENYKKHAATAGNTGKESAKSVMNDPSFKDAAKDLQTLFERFANGRSAQPIFDAFRDLVKTAANDKEMSAWFDKTVTYLKKLFIEPGFVLKEDADKEAKELRSQAKNVFEGKYKSLKDRILNEVTDFFSAMGEDPLNKKLGTDINQLFRDLLFDENGKWAFKSHLWADIRDKIVPPVMERIGAVPIPRIEYTDPMIDIVIENLVLQGKNLLPNYVTFEAYNYFKYSPYNLIKNNHKHDVKLELGQIQCDLRDVAFYVKKKVGFPRLQDAGLADIFLGGKGVSAKVHLEVDSNSSSDRIFSVKSVKASVGTLKFNIRESRHNLLYKTARPLATSLIKKQIVKAIQDGIKSSLESLNDKLVEIKKELEAAEKDDNSSKGEVLKKKFKKDDKSSKKESEKPSDSQFKIVASRDSKILDAGHSKGWINLQSKYEDQVKQGDNWHSKAFSLVSKK